MKSRLFFYLALIAVPVIALLCLGYHFLLFDAPRLVAAEKASVTMRNRSVAEVLIDDPDSANWHGERQSGWRQVSKIARKYPWGVVPRGNDTVLIWVQMEDRSVIGRDGFPEIKDDSWFWVYVPFCVSLYIVVMMFAVGLYLIIHYDRERESFLASMIHDLTNPLVSIRGLAKSDPEYAARIADSVLGMVRNAQDFLGLGRRRNLDIVRVDLVPLIRETYRMFEEYFTEDESGAVEFDLPEKLEVSADTMECRQILWNLFSNAAKYAAPYGPVKVSASVRGTSAAVEFADQGIGMTPRQMRRAFGRFYRAAGLHECGKGGFGIGLYTSRASARRMGGNLTVRSNTPKGCVFAFTLLRNEK